MADQKQVDKVLAGESQCQRFNLSGADFAGKDLSRRNFYQADLSGANLTGTDLRWSLIEQADLRGAKIDGTDFFACGINNGRFDDLIGIQRCVDGTTGPYKTPDPDAPIEDLRVPEGPEIVAFFFERKPIDRGDADRVEADSAIGSIRPL